MTSKKRFVLHYLEMVVAMAVGMVALGPVWSMAVPTLPAYPAAAAMVMATNMSIGMAGWMMIRRHSGRHIAEMCAAMVAPFVVLLIPYGMGLIDGGTLMTAGHILMFPAMLVPMLPLRRPSVRPSPLSPSRSR
jgi:hypothetical protein